MTHFEQLRTDLSNAVGSDNAEVKTRALEQSSAAGYFDGLTSDQVMVLKTIRGDLWRTRLEDSFALQPA